MFLCRKKAANTSPLYLLNKVPDKPKLFVSFGWNTEMESSAIRDGDAYCDYKSYKSAELKLRYRFQTFSQIIFRILIVLHVAIEVGFISGKV